MTEQPTNPSHQNDFENETPPHQKMESGHFLPSSTRPDERVLLAWDALEFTPQQKERTSWVRRTLFVAGSIAIIMLLLRNFLGAVVVLLGAFVFLLEAFRPPRQVHCTISDKGVSLGHSFHPYKELISFWIFPREKEISIKTKKWLSHHIVLPLGEADVAAAQSALAHFLPEEEQESSATNTWLQKIGF